MNFPIYHVGEIHESYLLKSSNSLVDQVQESLEELSLPLECPIASAKTKNHSFTWQLHESTTR